MPCSAVLSRSRDWPRVIAIALFAVGVAGCSDSGRLESPFSHPYSAKSRAAAPQPAPQEVTGSIASTPPAQVESKPLAQPVPSAPATVAAQGGVAQGAGGLGAYRPSSAPTDITGSVKTPPPQPSWTWDGGTPVTVGAHDSLESIARKYGVPAAAIMQANNIAAPSAIKPGQRLVIPRYQPAGAAPVAPAAKPAVSDGSHVVAPGESLIKIAKTYGVPLTTLAKANNIEPYAKVNIGDRLIIPGSQRAAAPLAPQIAAPRTVPAPKIAATEPAHNARLAAPGTPIADNAVKTAEPTGSMPSFRWPVRGRVIAGFGPKPNGQQNDGINLAVPEGTPIKATEDGVVAYAGNELKGYGNLVLVRHANGYVSAYAHASELMVKRGDTIKRGQVIARAGQTGNVTSPQLHFEIRKGSSPVDPTQYLGGA